MPFFILGVRIAEPPPACRAVHGRRKIAWLIVGRHSLAQAFQVFAVASSSPHQRTSRGHFYAPILRAHSTRIHRLVRKVSAFRPVNIKARPGRICDLLSAEVRLA